MPTTWASCSSWAPFRDPGSSRHEVGSPISNAADVEQAKRARVPMPTPSHRPAPTASRTAGVGATLAVATPYGQGQALPLPHHTPPRIRGRGGYSVFAVLCRADQEGM
jgi:hypothetical protein